jgi:chromate transporter
LAFILPGLMVILALAALFLGSPPRWVLAAGAGAGAAVPAVAVQAATGLIPASWRRVRAAGRNRTLRWCAYLTAGGAATATAGAWVVLVILSCAGVELTVRVARPPTQARAALPIPLLATGATTATSLVSVAWVALKVGALSYGGGFVIIPLMQADAVNHYHWMDSGQFLNAVALGQITPGPVVQTVAVVGYAAAGITGGLLASAVAFSPSFAFILLGADHFDRLRANHRIRAFLDGAGPAAIGAILGSAIPLTRALTQNWQYPILAGAVLLLVARRAVVVTLLASGAVGAALVAAGLPLSR